MIECKLCVLYVKGSVSVADSLSYSIILPLLLFSFDGAVLPIGLGLSLLLNAAFLARHINKEEGVLTLPDILSRRYGKLTEVFITSACIVSFMMLLAGNLVGMGNILSYVLDVSLTGAIWTASSLIWAYTISGGLFSVAYTDVAQGIMGWSGCIFSVFYLIINEEIRAPPPSIGLPG
jgi:Na+/proline symporter